MADAIYARYSSHAQDGGTSIEVQLEQCRKIAKAKPEEFVDKARSGRAVGGRDGLLKLLEAVASGKIDRVFVYKYDRLGRNLV